MDVGAGDGRFCYESARRDPASLYVGIDPDASALAEYAYRASRKPSRGGVENIVYVVASAESPPDELAGAASLVCVNFPWGALLRGVLRPDEVVLMGLRGFGAPGAEYRLVLCYDPVHDAAAFEDETPPRLDAGLIEGRLAPAYAESGIVLREWRLLSREEALAIPSSWGRRLLHGRPRDVYLLVADRR